MGFLRGLAAGSAVLICAAGVAGYAAWRGYVDPGPLPTAKIVVVPRGGVATLGRVLWRQGLVRAPWRLEAAALLTADRGPLHAAELSFPAHASLGDVLFVLRFGRPVQHLVTIAEGLTAAETAEVLASADGLMGPVAVPAEGSLLPQTYAYERGTSVASLVARGQWAMRRELDEAWHRRSALADVLRNPGELLALASLVERETALPAERARIAGVFINRLRRGMKLQSDPSVVYGASGGWGRLSRPITRADLDRTDAINTYAIASVPILPICAPGAASIEAAAQPVASADLYFVADGTGGHAFAATLEAHHEHVAAMRSQANRTAADRWPPPPR